MCIRDSVWLYLKDIWVDYYVFFSATIVISTTIHLDVTFQDGDGKGYKSTTTILNLRSCTCKHSKRYMQNWKYFRFVVAILKDWLAVDSNSIYLASVSFTSPKTYDYSLTSLWCEQHLPNWNYFRFLSAIFISGVMATPGDVNTIKPPNPSISLATPLILSLVYIKELRNVTKRPRVSCYGYHMTVRCNWHNVTGDSDTWQTGNAAALRAICCCCWYVQRV